MAWSAVGEEVKRWRDLGLVMPIWWRDDDAIEPTPALDRLLALAEAHDAPIHLAAPPARATEALAERLAASPRAYAHAHGWAHVDHSAEGAKKNEFNAERPLKHRRAEAAAGLERVLALFGARARRMFTPPWNRLAEDMAEPLARIGYETLSTYGPRRRAAAAGGLRVVNTHLDPIAWRGDRSALPVDDLDREMAAAMTARREGRADPAEPYGFLSHHLVHDAAIWDAAERWLALTRTAPEVFVFAEL